MSQQATKNKNICHITSEAFALETIKYLLISKIRDVVHTNQLWIEFILKVHMGITMEIHSSKWKSTYPNGKALIQMEKHLSKGRDTYQKGETLIKK